MDKYSTSFYLLTHLGVNNIPDTGILTKNKLSKCTIVGEKKLQKREGGDFEQRTSSQKSRAILKVVG